ncbi:MAG: hypothetical protein U0559_10640 [Anaerolineae bacterium]
MRRCTNVARDIVSPTVAAPANQALEVGRGLPDPTTISSITDQTPPALVAAIGGCRKIINGTTLNLDIDYVLLSNKTPPMSIRAHLSYRR